MSEKIDETMPSNTKLLPAELPLQEKIVLEQRVCKPIDQKPIYVGKVLQLTNFHFQDANGEDRYWEGVEKLSKAKNGSNSLMQSVNPNNSLITIATLKRQIMCDCLILVKQYRAQLKAYTLEFPATVLNSNEDPVDTANKEIEDGTGYTSTDIEHISPPVAIDTVLSTGEVRLVSVTIDGDDPLQQPSPKNSESTGGGHGSIAEVLQIPINGLLDRLSALNEEGIIIDSLVYAFAIGLKRGEKSALKRIINES